MRYNRLRPSSIPLGACLLIALVAPAGGRAEPIPSVVLECVGYLHGTVRIKDPATGQPKLDPKTKKPITKTGLLGTGFAARFEYPDDQRRVFLVTAKHVVYEEEGKSDNLHHDLAVRLNAKTGKPTNFSLPGPWLKHPDDGVDLAIHVGLPTEADYLVVSDEDWVSEDLVAARKIGVGDEVFYTGLLPHYPEGTRLNPITRFGRLALVSDTPSVGGRWLDFLDAQNMGGHSGSPVFLWATPQREQRSLV